MKFIIVLVLAACFVGVELRSTGGQSLACSTAECKETADFITDALNTSVNPCDNFYEYACGGFKKHPIPDGSYSLDNFSSLSKKIMTQIKELLLNFNVSKEEKNQSSAVTLAASTFQKCMSAGQDEKSLKEVVESVIGGWHIGQTVTEKELSWTEAIVQSFVKGTVYTLFSVGIGPNTKDVTKNAIWFNPAALGLGDKELQHLITNEKTIIAYKDYIRSAAKLFCGSDCSKLEEDINSIVSLESALANAKMPIEDQRNPSKTDVLLTIKEFNEQSKFNWSTEILTPIWKHFGSSEIPTDSDYVHLNDVEYFTKIVQILKRTAPRTIANFIGWRLVSTHGPQSSEAFRKFAFNFHKVTTGLQKIPDRWESCYFQVNGNLGAPQLSRALSRLYVDKYFSNAEKEAASKMVDGIQKSYHDIIVKNNWLDDETRAKALKKLEMTKKKIGYSEKLSNNTALNQMYHLQNQTFASELIADKNYLLSMVKLNVNSIKAQIAVYRGASVLNDLWILSAVTTNAVYFAQENSITIPAGILKFPFFAANRPYSINYGFIGVIIAHEFTHGLDDRGRKFDAFGNLNDWWTQVTTQRFQQKSQCFVKQYGSLIEPVSGLHVNGETTLGENIADNGGVHVAFEAFSNRQKEEGKAPQLAGLPQYSPEQLFFISWANAWCQVTNPQIMKLLVQYDAHSPAQFRVNVPLSNSKHFTEAFKCPVGSKMNLKDSDKCSVW